MGRFLAVFAVVVGLSSYGWYSGWFSSAPSPNDEKPAQRSASTGKTEQPAIDRKTLGDSLYTAAALQPLPVQSARDRDPVAIPAVFETVNKVDFSPPVPGRILFIGTEVPEGVAQIAGVTPYFQQKFQYAPINQGGREIYKIYLPLAEGDTVREGQMLVQIDPAKAINNLQEKIAKLNAATAEAKAAKEVDKVAEAFLEADNRLFAQKIIAERELHQSQLTRIKTQQEFVAKTEAVNQAVIEKRAAEIMFNDHQIVNRINVTQSTIKTIFKNLGDVVKEYDQIMHVYASYRLKATGNVEAERDVRTGRDATLVTIEPILDSTPDRTLRQHSNEITCLAVTSDNHFVTGSEDKEVHLWSRNSAQPLATPAHKYPVRSLACSPRGSQGPNWCIVGTSDGTLTVYSLPSFQRVGLPLEREHADSVTALAFSPNGLHFASAAADGSVRVYEIVPETKEGSAGQLVPKFKYTLSAKAGANAHTGVVTSLHFTPQATLVSAARDQTIRVWQLHEKGAGDPLFTLQGRTGNVAKLGVSPSGRWILRDQGKTLQFIDATNGKTMTTLQNPDSVPFERVAVFSHSDANPKEELQKSMLLTAGAAEGRLQLWRTPSTDGKRGFEVRQFATRERSPVTVAAFAYPDEKTGEIPFAISGTKDGWVYLWSIPKASDVDSQRIHNVPITEIGYAVDLRQKRIAAEITNPDGRLSPGRPVTIVIGE